MKTNFIWLILVFFFIFLAYSLTMNLLRSEEYFHSPTETENGSSSYTSEMQQPTDLTAQNAQNQMLQPEHLRYQQYPFNLNISVHGNNPDNVYNTHPDNVYSTHPDNVYSNHPDNVFSSPQMGYQLEHPQPQSTMSTPLIQTTYPYGQQGCFNPQQNWAQTTMPFTLTHPTATSFMHTHSVNGIENGESSTSLGYAPVPQSMSYIPAHSHTYTPAHSHTYTHAH